MKQPALSEATLTKQLQSHERDAMRQFYGLVVGYLTSVCSRYLVDQEDVKDVLQESFIKIFNSIEQFEFRGEGSLRAWAARIVTNEALNFLRKNALESPISFVEQVPDTPDEDPDVDDVPPEVIQRFIQQLPPGYRAVFNLYVFEDKSHQEIAQLLHIKESSSASQLHRAKEILAREINEYKARNNIRSIV